MLEKIINNFKSLDKITFKIMKNGLIFCFIICILSAVILFTYNFILPSPFVYYIGINLFKLSLIYSIEFVVCGFVIDGIKGGI